MLVRHGRFWDGIRNVPFTPQAEGAYRIRIRGGRGFGSYTLGMALIAGEPDQRNTPVPLAFEEGRQGDLAAGAYDEYLLTGHHNTPVLFTLQRPAGELVYRLEIYDAQNRRIARHGRFYGDTYQIPFTPQIDGEYRLRIAGDRNFGTYLLNVRLLSGSPPERNQTKSLEIGGSHRGKLAAGAFDDYRFLGHAGQRLVFTSQRSDGELGYWAAISDPAGNELVRHGRFYGDSQRFEFHPQADGTYRIRISADREFGSYVLSLNEG